MFRQCVWLFPLCILTGELALPAQQFVVPDLILHNAKVVTVDKRFSVKQAIAIRGNRILAVDDNKRVLALVGPSTNVIDVQGKTVIPGLIDDHYHMLSKALDQYLGVEVALVPSIIEMLNAIKVKVDQSPAGATVYTTSGWLPEQLSERRTPNRHDLDSVAPNNPVVVQGGHTMYLNSMALRTLGMTRDTASPPGGHIEKDPNTGEPTGLLVDNAMALANKLIPVPTHAQKLEAIRYAQKKENAVGITGIREPGINPDDMRAYEELWNRGELTLRVSMNLNLDHRLPAATLIEKLRDWGVSTGFGNPLLRIDGIGEFGIDGGFEAALMSQPYEGTARVKTPGPFYGLQRIPTDTFQAVLSEANRLGWRGSIHTVGDKAMDIVLDTYGKANQDLPIVRKRWVIEHAHYTRPDQFRRIKALDITLSTQFHPYMAAQTMVDNWGPERAAKAMRARDWLDAGLRVGGGSDWSLVPANPFWIMYFFVTRDTRLWGVLGADQKLTREEALRMMTINNAYLTFDEDNRGSLECGKLADLVILSEDFLTVPAAKIRAIRVLLTILDGKVVYREPGAYATLH
ncbi:MAG TPA: amidohydrolase [Candidatus Dormibacteraeota bacterium]|nr:amidohydrolase [Candidatus Dormibacteraeota bacterium]